MLRYFYSIQSDIQPQTRT